MPFKKGDPNINRKGPPRGQRNKIPSEKALQDEYLKNADKALTKLVSILDDPKAKHADQYKAATFIAGKCFEIIIERNKEDEGKADNKPKGTKEEETKETDNTPKFSLKAVKS